MNQPEYLKHLDRIQAALAQCRGRPDLALTIIGAALVPFRKALDLGGVTTGQKFRAVQQLCRDLGPECLASVLIHVLGLVGTGLQGVVIDARTNPAEPPGPDPIGELE